VSPYTIIDSAWLAAYMPPSTGWLCWQVSTLIGIIVNCIPGCAAIYTLDVIYVKYVLAMLPVSMLVC
jgi:hypothetical protein